MHVGLANPREGSVGSQKPPLPTLRELLRAHGEALGVVCRELGVLRLLAFGSALSDDEPLDEFDGIDFSVVFGPAAGADPAVRTLGLRVALESLFSVPVDLVELADNANARQTRILQGSQVVVYERMASA
jgi:predicted nucleotidyltransferase